MTGYGEAVAQNEHVYCRVEIRTVNNRHFKLSLKCPDSLQPYETELERVLRESISRGTVQLAIRLDGASSTAGQQINRNLLKWYWQQLHELAHELSAPAPGLTELLELPGVLCSGEADPNVTDSIWPLVEQTVRDAGRHLQEFRQKEGEATTGELRQLFEAIERELAQVAQLAPLVARDYHDKLLQRMRELLASTDVVIEPKDIIREVALYADRCDIHEEITRLRSHISQFVELMNGGTSPGRKLDFLCQEMFREANTIGAKANHVGLSHAAVDMKSSIERIREIVQNVE